MKHIIRHKLFRYTRFAPAALVVILAMGYLLPRAHAANPAAPGTASESVASQNTAAASSAGANAAAAESAAAKPKSSMHAASKSNLDRSGHARVGKASFYADRLGGRKMADGTPMHLQGNNAASKTLPLGTTAVVTNLKTDRRAIVTIRDRGPYVKGRIVDLSPATAKKIGLQRKQGITKVEVAPIAVPLGNGTVKLTDSVAKLKKK